MCSKKFLSLLLSIIMIIGIIPISSLAVEEVGIIVSAQNSVSLNDEFTVEYVLNASGDGIYTLTFNFVYDTEYFQMQSAAIVSSATSAGWQGSASVDSPQRVAVTRVSDATWSDVFATATFKAKKAFSDDKTFSVEVTECERFDLNTDFASSVVVVSDTVSYYTDPTSLVLSPTSLSLLANGDAKTITAITDGTTAVEWSIEDPELFSSTSTSSDTRVLTLTPGATAGTTTIHATTTNEEGNDFSASCDVTISANTSATLSFEESAPYRFDSTLTTKANGTASDDKIDNYKWYRVSGTDETIIDDATENSHKLVKADIGYKIKVTADLKNVDSIPYHNNPLSAITSDVISKATQSTPTDLTATDVKAVSLKLTATNTEAASGLALEYSKDNIVWQESAEFTELTEDTEYTFYVRVKSSDTYEPSDTCSVTLRTPKVQRGFTGAVTPDTAGETLKIAVAPSEGGYGTTVTATATNSDTSKYRFKGWSLSTPCNDVSSTTDATAETNTISFTAPKADVLVTANYLTVNATPTEPTAVGTLTNAGGAAVEYTKVVGLKYLVTSSNVAPGYDAAWSSEAVNTDKVSVEVANHGATYYVYAYKPGDNNTTYNSGIAQKEVTIPHYYAWSRTPEGEITFVARQGGEMPGARTITITNVGSDELSGVTASITDDKKLELVGAPSGVEIAKNGEISFTVKPIEGSLADLSNNVATITVVAKKGSGSEEMTKMEIPVKFDVVEKTVVNIAAPATTTQVYNGQEFDPLGTITATYTNESGTVETFLSADLVKVFTYADGTTGTDAPKVVGDYTLTITVNEANKENYMVGDSGTIPFKITPRPLTVKGLAVEEKTYDGTKVATITSTGATLVGTPTEANGVVVADKSKINVIIPATATFASKDAADGITVTITDIKLTDTDAGATIKNYTITDEIVLKGKINPKPIELVATASDKVYDGKVDATVSVKFRAEDLVEDESFTITVIGSRFATSGTDLGKNVGSNKLVDLGTIKVEAVAGTNASNYSFTTTNVGKPHATITQLGKQGSFNSFTTPQKFGSVTYPTATYDALSGDTATATVLYKPTGTNDASYTDVQPINAGTYQLSMRINDGNYTLTDIKSEPVQFVITQADTTGTGTITLGVPSLQSSIVEFDLSAFNASPTNGTYAVKTIDKANKVITETSAKPVTVNGKKLSFYIQTGAKSDNTDSITLVFTPSDSNYAAKEFTLNVKRAEEKTTVSIIDPVKSIKLGDDIFAAMNAKGTKLKIVYASHSDANKELAPADWTASATDYDKNDTATGPHTMYASYTDAADNKWGSSFTFEVVDYVTSITVTAPAKVNYKVGESEFDFANGSYKRTWKSEVVDKDSTPITKIMCTVDGKPLSESILNKVGTYVVSVTDAASGVSGTFDITVEAPKQDKITTITNDAPVGVTDIGTATFTDDSGGALDAGGIELEITEASNSDASLTDALKGKLGNTMDGNTLSTMHLTLKNNNKAVKMGGKLKVRVPVPAGSAAGSTFAVAIVGSDGKVTTVVPTRVGDFLEFELTANDVDIAIASRPYQSTTTGFNYLITYTHEDWVRDNQYDQMAPASGLEPDVKQTGYQNYVNDVITAYGNQQASFWDVVRSTIKTSAAGTVIRADAKTFDQMPADIMNLVCANSVTLVLGWAWGKDITITPNNALVPEVDRVYYPLSYLVTALSATTGSTAASVLLVPQTGDAIQVLSMTPAAFGMLDGAKPSIGNAVAALDIAVEDNVAAPFPYLPVALGALAAALLLAGLALGRRRRKGEK